MLRPTIIGAKFHKRQIIRHHIGTQHIAFVYDAPQTALFVPIETNGIAHTNGVRDFLVLSDVIFQHHRTAVFSLHAMLTNIAVRSHCDVDFLAIGGSCKVASPMIVRRLGVELCQLLTLGGNFRITRFIWENDQAIGVGNIELLANQDHAERRIQPC